MRWFGPRWDAPVCDDGTEVEVPVGEHCGYCECVIEDGERGLVLLCSTTLRASGDWPVHLHCLSLAIGNGRKE